MLPIRSTLLLSLVVCFFLCGTCTVRAGVQPTNGEQGREFWIAIPPNDMRQSGSRRLEIAVTSAYDTEVTLEYPASGFKSTKAVKAYQTTTFTTDNQSASWSWEIRESEKVSAMGIHLTADKPFAVNVLSAKTVSTDGYAALPVRVWGKEYYHLGFWDFNETLEWSGGFVIVAQENGTTVHIDLNGVNNAGSTGRTAGGKKIGESISIALQRGQTYMVAGNGLTLGLFDISGTHVTSNKPIGFLSYHQRTMIPAFPAPNNGRDHLVEMLPPVSAWGKEHVTMEFNWGAGKGDFFRVLAAEDNTRFTCRYTDFVTGETYVWQGLLQKKGMFAEKENTWPPSIAVRGVARWTADKPILVMQYAYSAYWDGLSNHDPLMICSVPTNQYTPNTILQTPVGEGVSHMLHLVAIGDSTDAEHTMLNSITMNGEPIVHKAPLLTVHRIPGTNYYWTRLPLASGTYDLRGKTKFGAVMYGNGLSEQYGWPAAFTVNKADVLDTLPPVVAGIAQACSRYTIIVTEQRDEAATDGNRPQIDAGLSRVALDDEDSFNMKLGFVAGDEDDVHVEPRRESLTFHIEVIDPTKDGFARFYVLDRVGNMVIDSVRYHAEKVLAPEVVRMKVPVQDTHDTTIVVRNPGDRPIEMQRLYLLQRRVFRILSPSPSAFPLLIPGGDSLQVQIQYTPGSAPTGTETDRDSLRADFSCGPQLLTALEGNSSGKALIMVSDADFGTVVVGTKKCLPHGIGISNPGKDTLIITDIFGPDAPFFLENLAPALPVVVPPGGNVVLKTLCFEPQESGMFLSEIRFASNASSESSSNDNVAMLMGEGVGTVDVLTGEEAGAYTLQVAPVPATDVLTVSFSLPVAGEVRLTLCDMAGRQVYTLADGYFGAGKHGIMYPTDNLAAGMYICRLTVHGQTFVYCVPVVK